MPSKPDVSKISFWEKVDLPFLQLSLYATMVYASVTGVFRGKASPKRYNQHVMRSVIRKLIDRVTDNQVRYVSTLPATLPVSRSLDINQISHFHPATSNPTHQAPTKPS